MAGIYIHIPFCKQRCSYCDFYTRVAPRQIDDTVNAIVREMEIRAEYLKGEPVQTIYFGGGTPSLLTAEQFQRIFDKLYALFEVNSNAEITFEANPDDLTPAFFDSIKHLPFNRISIGIQSFDDEQLKKINRRHSGDEAIAAFTNARKAGFENISIDLIYGLPLQSKQSWELQLDKALSLEAEHISIYGLTYEEGTPLHKLRELGRVSSVDDSEMIEMHKLMLQKIEKAGYEAYEISNFAKPGLRSQHNSAYWKMTPYLGLGPSAHSYDGESRQWNVSSIKEYNLNIIADGDFFEREVLTLIDKYNEYMMVAFRTKEGVNLSHISEKFGADFHNKFMTIAQKQIEEKYMIVNDEYVSLTLEGILISNLLIENFVFV
jgi:oxygen-independent coproporphyrinogen III oxidase